MSTKKPAAKNQDRKAPVKKKQVKKKLAEKTEDGHYVVIDGRKWRATNPNLPEEKRQELVNELMAARRAVGAALKAKDEKAEAAARDRVQAAKEGLGERGPKWWEENESSKTQKSVSKNVNKKTVSGDKN